MKRHLTLALGMALGSAVLLHAHLDTPPPGHTGAPGDETCAAASCHEGADATGAPNLGIITFNTYSEDVIIRVILSEGDAGFQTEHVGFQAVVLDPVGNPTGTVTESSDYIQIDTGAGGRAYVSQTEAGGTKPIWSGAVAYEFMWERPSGPTDSGIVFVTGLWSNGDSTRLGDAQAQQTVRLFPCTLPMTGDVDANGVGTSSDVIYLLNYIFKSGPEPQPCVAVADVNCDGRITLGDVIHMVNWLFKLVPLCDVCPLIWDGVWTCE